MDPTGAFDKLTHNSLADSESDAASVADSLNRSAALYYGTASRAFLAALVKDIDYADSKTNEYMGYFLNKLDLPKSGWERRIAKKFALCYAAGRLGMEYGVLPWDRATNSYAAYNSYKIWRQKLVTKEDEIRDAWAKIKPLFRQKNLDRQGSGKAKYAGLLHDYKGKRCAYIPTNTLNSLIPNKPVREALLTKLRDQGMYNAPATFPRSFGQQIKLPHADKKQYYAIFSNGVRKFRVS